MIPEKIIKFVNERSNMAFGGIRDANLHPSGCRVSGWKVNPDGRTLTALIPDPFIDHILAALTDNGQFAMTVEEHPTHETYQIKGNYLRHRPVEPRDLELVRTMRARLARSVPMIAPPGVGVDFLLSVQLPDPAVAIEIAVREVYLQTPGPGAGSRLHPAPAA